MDQLKRLRAEKGLSQSKLAALADLDPSTVNQIERGAREASPATLRKLADALEVSIAELLEDTSPKAPLRLSLQPTLNGFEDERLANWRAAVDNARRLREGGRTRMEGLLAEWHASRDREEPSAARRGYLDDMGELLQQAYDAETELLQALAGRLGPNELPELQAADSFYGGLIDMVAGARYLSIDKKRGRHQLEEAA